MSVIFGWKTPHCNCYPSSIGCKSCGQFVLSNEKACEFSLSKKKKKKETNLNKKMATSEVKKNAIVGKILLVQKLIGKDNVRRLQEIDNQIYTA